jgi:hypothetical protein
MIYNVVLNSNLKSSGTVSNATYYFDWSILPNSKYKVSSTFVSSAINATTPNIALLEVQLGQSNNFKFNATQTRASTTNAIGILKPNATGASTYMFGDIITLPPVFLNQRPNNNEFNVRITSNAAVAIDWVDYTSAQMTDYVLVLSFEDV